MISGVPIPAQAGNSGKVLTTDGSKLQFTNLSGQGNVVYCYNTGVDRSATQTGTMVNSSLTSITGAVNIYLAHGQSIGSPEICLRSKFKKQAGVDSLTVYVQAWKLNNGGTVRIDVGTTNLVLQATTGSPAFYTGTLDVSSLTNGTVYDLTVSLYEAGSSGGDGSYTFLGGVIIFAG